MHDDHVLGEDREAMIPGIDNQVLAQALNAHSRDQDRADAQGSDALSDDELFAYASDALDDHDTQRIRRRLVASSADRQRFADIAAFADPATATATDFERHAAWRDLESRLTPTRRRSNHRRLGGLIAALMVACLGLGLWVNQLHGRLDAASSTDGDRPALSVLSTLELIDATRSRPRVESLEIGDGEPFHLVLFVPAAPTDCRDVTLDLLWPSGERSRLGGLELKRDSLTFLIRRGQAGAYRADVLGCGAETKSFFFEVNRPDAR